MTNGGTLRGRLAALALVAALAVAIEWLVGWGALARAWVTAGPRILPALAFLGLSYLARAWRFQRYFGARLAGRFGAVLRISAIHNFSNTVMPMRTGEAAFPLMMKREFDIAIVSSSAALAWFRILDLCVLVAVGILLARSAALPEAGSTLQALGWGGFAACLALPWVVFHFGRALGRRVAAESFVGRVTAGLPERAGTVAFDLAATLAMWSCKVSAIGMLIDAFTGAPFAASTIAALTGELTGGLPLPVPAGIGTYEAGVVGALALAGIEAKAALAAAVNAHLLLIAFALVAGGIGLAASRR